MCGDCTIICFSRLCKTLSSTSTETMQPQLKNHRDPGLQWPLHHVHRLLLDHVAPPAFLLAAPSSEPALPKHGQSAHRATKTERAREHHIVVMKSSADRDAELKHMRSWHACAVPWALQSAFAEEPPQLPAPEASARSRGQTSDISTISATKNFEDI